MIFNLLIWAIALASLAGVILRPRGVSEVWWASGGALLLILLALLPVSQALIAVRKGGDVYWFLTGMMILSELARQQGVFDWLAGWAAVHAAGSPRRLFLVIYLAGVVVTVFLSNDATVVVLTPAVLTIVRRLKVDPRPHLLACALVANAASFVFPISNPANLVIYAGRMPPLGRWLATFSWPSVAAIALTGLFLLVVTRRQLQGSIDAGIEKSPLKFGGRLALAGLGLAAIALLTASALGWSLGAPTCLAALLATALVSCSDHQALPKVLSRVAWSVIPLVASLFIIVEAVGQTGLLGLVNRALERVAGLDPLWHDLIIGFSVGMLTNFMNNLPLGLISGQALQAVQGEPHLATPVLLGVDLGPNLSVTGSLATILWLIALRREQIRITDWEFLKVGLLIMPPALLASLLLLRL